MRFKSAQFLYSLSFYVKLKIFSFDRIARNAVQQAPWDLASGSLLMPESLWAPIGKRSRRTPELQERQEKEDDADVRWKGLFGARGEGEEQRGAI